MNVEVIRQIVRPQEVTALRKDGCDKAKANKQFIADIGLSCTLMRQDIEKIKEKINE